MFELIYEEQEGNPTSPNFDRAYTVVVLRGDEEIWVRHDHLTRRVIRVEPDTAAASAVKPIEALESLRSEQRLEKDEALTIAIPAEVPVTPIGEWEWDFDLIPDASFSIEYRYSV